MKEAGILNTSIPYDDNMIISINNKPAKLLKVNKMFVGAQLAKGESDFTITYINIIDKCK